VRHYGFEPPWSGKAYFGLDWVRVEEDDWFGKTVYWELRPTRATLTRMSHILKEFYLQPLIKQLNSEMALTSFLNAETAA
jgi:hypothetical protein